MPAMYPEELRDLRSRHPELQYDFRGNVIGVTPLDSVQQAANAIYQLPGMQPNAWDFGPTRNDYLNSKDFVGPMPQQWWDPNGELMQQGQDWLGGFMQGFDLQPRRASRPRNPYASQPSQPQPATDFGGQQDSALHANVEGLGTDYMRQPGDVNPLGYRPPAQAARPYGSNADELWPLIQGNPGYNPQSSPRGWN